MRKYDWTRKGMVRDDTEGTYVHAAEVEAERAELLAALKSLVDSLGAYRGGDLEYFRHLVNDFTDARAAIAKAEENS